MKHYKPEMQPVDNSSLCPGLPGCDQCASCGRFTTHHSDGRCSLVPMSCHKDRCMNQTEKV